jgi:hypothetical protein
MQAGSVLACLRSAKTQLSQKCRQQVLRTQQEAVEDYRTDYLLFTACKVRDYDRYIRLQGLRTQDWITFSQHPASATCYTITKSVNMKYLPCRTTRQRCVRTLIRMRWWIAW